MNVKLRFCTTDRVANSPVRRPFCPAALAYDRCCVWPIRQVTIDNVESVVLRFFFAESTCDGGSAPVGDSNFQCPTSSSEGRRAHLRATHAVFSVGQVVCQRMWLLPLL